MKNHDKIIIVCSGLSAQGFKPPGNIPVIAVNGAIDWLCSANYFFTLDPSEVNRERMLSRREGVKYYAAYNEPIPNITMLERIEYPTMGIGGRFAGVAGLSRDKNKINTGNSAYGALGLAFNMGAKKIVIVGLDGKSDRVEGGRSKDLSHLPILFSTALSQLDEAGVEVVNASVNSNIDCFPRMTHKEAIEWIK
ncbi:MAG: norphogenetic protein [bacterium]|nr:norphogenetic protein [bacterium]